MQQLRLSSESLEPLASYTGTVYTKLLVVKVSLAQHISQPPGYNVFADMLVWFWITYKKLRLTPSQVPRSRNGVLCSTNVVLRSTGKL